MQDAPWIRDAELDGYPPFETYHPVCFCGAGGEWTADPSTFYLHDGDVVGCDQCVHVTEGDQLVRCPACGGSSYVLYWCNTWKAVYGCPYSDVLGCTNCIKEADAERWARDHPDDTEHVKPD